MWWHKVERNVHGRENLFQGKLELLCIFDPPVRLCGHHRLSLFISSVSLFPHTVRLCEAEGKELAVSCQHWRHQKGLFGRSWGAWAQRIAAGITQGETLLLQGWFRTIMEKLCGGFSANHPDARTHMHTRTAYIIYIWSSLAHIHKNN